MSPKQPMPQDDPVADDKTEGQPPPSPDQDGPHDVPDDRVIEKTLPKPRSDKGDGRAS